MNPHRRHRSVAISCSSLLSKSTVFSFYCSSICARAWGQHALWMQNHLVIKCAQHSVDAWLLWVCWTSSHAAPTQTEITRIIAQTHCSPKSTAPPTTSQWLRMISYNTYMHSYVHIQDDNTLLLKSRWLILDIFKFDITDNFGVDNVILISIKALFCFVIFSVNDVVITVTQKWKIRARN